MPRGTQISNETLCCNCPICFRKFEHRNTKRLELQLALHMKAAHHIIQNNVIDIKYETTTVVSKYAKSNNIIKMLSDRASLAEKIENTANKPEIKS